MGTNLNLEEAKQNSTNQTASPLYLVGMEWNFQNSEPKAHTYTQTQT